jgi:hypothetical protein
MIAFLKGFATGHANKGADYGIYQCNQHQPSEYTVNGLDIMHRCSLWDGKCTIQIDKRNNYLQTDWWINKRLILKKQKN